MKHKFAFIGPANIHQSFSTMDTDWDFQKPIRTLQDFEEELNSDEELYISKDTSVIIFFSRLFNQDPTVFADLVAYSAPYSVVCILTPTSDMDKVAKMESAIRTSQTQMSISDSDYNMNTPFFICSYENAQEDICKAIEGFIASTVIPEENKTEIKKILPHSNIEFEDSQIFESETDEIILPEKDSTKGKVIVVTSSKGGSGKSTVSVSLASTIAKASRKAAQKGLTDKILKVCLVDLDVRDGQLGFLNGVMKPTIIDILTSSGGANPSEAHIKNGLIYSEKLEVSLLLASKRPRNAKNVPAQFYVEVIDKLQDMFDVVILDTSVNYLDELLEKVAYPMADKIILVSDMSISSIYGCTRWIIETVESDEASVEADKVGVVINRAMQDVNMPIDKIQMATRGLPIISLIPTAPSVVTLAANIGDLSQILVQPAIKNAIFNIATFAIEDSPLEEFNVNE